MNRAITPASPTLKDRIRAILPMSVQPAARRAAEAVRRVKSTVLVPVYRRRNVGPGCLIDRSVQILGWRSVTLGRNVVICEGSWINVNAYDPKETSISIGDFSLIGRRNSISSGKRIMLGPYTLTGPNCNIIGSDHIYSNPLQPYVTTGSTTDTVIVVEANCWLGASVTIIGNVVIGRGSVIGAGALVTKDVPPFSIAIGSPARIVKRFDFSSNRWVRAEAFTPALEALLPTEESYRASLAAQAEGFRMPYLASGHRAGDSL